jgi:hypothetical protein
MKMMKININITAMVDIDGLSDVAGWEVSEDQLREALPKVAAKGLEKGLQEMGVDASVFPQERGRN